MPSLVATTSALARKPCVSTHYVRTNYCVQAERQYYWAVLQEYSVQLVFLLQEYSVQLTFRQDWLDPRLAYTNIDGKGGRDKLTFILISYTIILFLFL